MEQPNEDERSGPKIDWFGLARTHGKAVLTVAAVATAVVGIAGAVYLKFGQQSHIVASLEFRPKFAGLAELQYPNGLPFSQNDVTAGPILDLVYDSSDISRYCDRDAFRGGFFVEQRSDQSVFLDLEYQARLSEPRITMVERKLLQEEHAAKRKSLPLQYRLVFVTPQACSRMTTVVVSKVMVAVLNTWAEESDTKRGVLKHQVEVLTPAVLDVDVTGPGGLLLRADLLRIALERVIENVAEVGRLPGAALVRLGPERVTFIEVRGKLGDLVGSKLDPLVMTSGRSMVRESAAWITEAVAASERRQVAATARAASYHDALREYTGSAVVSGGQTAQTGGSGQGVSSASAAAPQLVDTSVLNKMVELSADNVRYRQKYADAMVEWEMAAVNEQLRVAYYKRLLQSLNQPASSDADAKSLQARLDDIAAEGKRLTAKFGELYDEFSRVALRAAGAMYVTEKPVTIEITQAFNRRELLNLMVMVFMTVLMLTLAFRLVRGRLKLEPR